MGEEFGPVSGLQGVGGGEWGQPGHRHAGLGGYKAGNRVNIETDILATHVEKLMSLWAVAV